MAGHRKDVQMAKRSSRTIAIWITVALTILSTVGAAVYGYGKLNQKQTNQTEKHSEMKKDGCDPARSAMSDIKVIKSKIETIDKNQEYFRTEQSAMRKEQKEGFEKILDEIRK